MAVWLKDRNKQQSKNNNTVTPLGVTVIGAQRLNKKRFLDKAKHRLFGRCFVWYTLRGSNPGHPD